MTSAYQILHVQKVAAALAVTLRAAGYSSIVVRQAVGIDVEGTHIDIYGSINDLNNSVGLVSLIAHDVDIIRHTFGDWRLRLNVLA